MSEPLVHIIDDDEAVRVSLEFLLDMQGFPARTYDSATAFLARVDTIRSGCIVTDIRMPEVSGLELARELKAQGSPLPVIIITGHGDLALAIEAMRAGVVDFLEKPFEDTDLVNAIRKALDGRQTDAEALAERERCRELMATLSGREQDVLRGVVGGKLNKVIAFDLGISPRTVEVYRAHLMSKTGARNVSELVRIALAAGH